MTGLNLLSHRFLPYFFRVERELYRKNSLFYQKFSPELQVFEVSSEGSGAERAAQGVFGRVRALGWAGDLAPPLERLCAACKHIESWLALHPKNVAVLLAW